MATTLKSANVLTFKYTAAAALTSGSPIVVASARVVVPMESASTSDTLAVAYAGDFRGIAKQTNAPWSVGTNVYWNASNSEYTTVATGGVQAGAAIAASTTTQATGDIRLGWNV